MALDSKVAGRYAARVLAAEAPAHLKDAARALLAAREFIEAARQQLSTGNETWAQDEIAKAVRSLADFYKALGHGYQAGRLRTALPVVLARRAPPGP